MKKLIIVIISIIVVIIIALLAPPITSKSLVPTPAPQQANVPTPRPTPLLKIDSNSNLSEESKKLNVPDYQSDFAVLDKTLSEF